MPSPGLRNASGRRCGPTSRSGTFLTNGSRSNRSTSFPTSRWWCRSFRSTEGCGICRRCWAGRRSVSGRCCSPASGPGRALQQLLLEDRDPFAAVGAVARAVAAFNQDDSGMTRGQSVADQLEDVRLAAGLVAWACPDASAAVAEITAAVVDGLSDAPPAPIHGDLKTDHVFLSGDGVTFIDLDSAVLGDPVRDPAHLFAYMTSQVGLEGMPPERARAAAQTFVEEYFRHVPTAWRRRFPLHCAGALVEVASGIFRRQDPQWQEKVAAVIADARTCLSWRAR